MSLSDVYSFGVFMWEVYELGKQPWGLMRKIEIAQEVLAGGRLQPPRNLPQKTYAPLSFVCCSQFTD